MILYYIILYSSIWYHMIVFLIFHFLWYYYDHIIMHNSLSYTSQIYTHTCIGHHLTYKLYLLGGPLQVFNVPEASRNIPEASRNTPQKSSRQSCLRRRSPRPQTVWPNCQRCRRASGLLAQFLEMKAERLSSRSTRRVGGSGPLRASGVLHGKGCMWWRHVFPSGAYTKQRRCGRWQARRVSTPWFDAQVCVAGLVFVPRPLFH